MTIKKLAAAAVSTVALAVGTAAYAQDTTLRIQTHYAPESVSGKLAAQFVDDVQTIQQSERARLRGAVLLRESSNGSYHAFWCQTVSELVQIPYKSKFFSSVCAYPLL